MQHSQGVLTLPLHPARRQVLLALIDEKLARLAQHRYFRACYGGTLSRERLIAVVKQLYCFFELFRADLSAALGTAVSRPGQYVLTAACPASPQRRVGPC